MPHQRARRGPPDQFAFEGSGDEARQWLDTVYGTSLRLTGPLGRVRHDRVDHGFVAFDHLKIDATFAFDSDPMPALVVVDVFGGQTQYTRDGVTDCVSDGGSVLVSGWEMPFTGGADFQDVRVTTLRVQVLVAAVKEVAPDYPWQHITFSSYVPQSAVAGARWRATVDQLSSVLPEDATPEQAREAARLLGYTLLHTFPNNVALRVADSTPEADDEPTEETVRRAVRVIESHGSEELGPAELADECGVSTRALQYAFRKRLGCTPQDYLRRVRLDLARQSMRDGSSTSVTDAAARHGFFNPGRFASDYRQVFDENPGQTMQRAND